MRRLLIAAVAMLLPAVARCEEPKNLLKPVDKDSSWRLELAGGGKGALEIADAAAVFKVTKTTGTNWHVQAFQVDLDLQNGKEYTVKLKMSAPQPRGVTVAAMIDKDDWHDIGLHESFTVGKDLKAFEYTFRAANVAEKKNRIGFILGEETGDVVVKEMTLTEKKP
jgi:hypothetical protein